MSRTGRSCGTVPGNGGPATTCGHPESRLLTFPGPRAKSLRRFGLATRPCRGFEVDLTHLERCLRPIRRPPDAKGAWTEGGTEHLADESAMGGVKGAYGGRREAWLDGLLTAPGPARLGRDPQVARVAALEFGDDGRPGSEPPREDLHGRAAQRDNHVSELDACLAIEVQRADFEPGEFGDGPASVGHERGHGGGAQRSRDVGMDGPADGQVVQEPLGVGGSEEVAPGRRLTVMAVGQAEEFGQGIVRVDTHAHRVGIRSRLRPAESVARAGLARGRSREPRVGARRVHKLADGDIRGIGTLQGVLQVLIEVVPPDSPGGHGELAIGQMADEVVNGFACRPIPCSWHARRIAVSCDNSKKPLPPTTKCLPDGRLRSGPDHNEPIRSDPNRAGPCNPPPGRPPGTGFGRFLLLSGMGNGTGAFLASAASRLSALPRGPAPADRYRPVRPRAGP